MSAFREWLNALFGSDGGRGMQVLFSLLIVVLLILAITWLFRRLFDGPTHRGRSSRLGVVDSAVVDHHRRLVLVRRDDVEHLVLVGGPNDVLVESRILKAPPVLAGRPAAGPQIVPRPQGADAVEEAEPTPAVAPPPAADDGSAKARVVAGAAGVAAAVASAGALLRSRVARSEPAPTERRTLDEAFDAPLGRTVEVPPVVAPPVDLDAVAPVAPPAPPVAAERVAVEPPARPEPAPARVEPARIETPVPRSVDELDLFADIADPLPPPAQRPVPPPAPPVLEPVRVEPRTPPVWFEPRPEPARVEPARVETARVEAPRVEPVAPPPVLPVIEPPVVEAPLPPLPPIEDVAVEAPVAPPSEADKSEFDFDFDFAPMLEPELGRKVAAPAMPRVEPTLAFEPEPAPVVVPPPPVVAPPEPEIVPEPVIAPVSAPVAAAVIVPVLPDLVAEPVAHEPAFVEPVVADEPFAPIPEVVPPEPAHRSGDHHATVDELEEEMARLLSELSGQTRR
jgi:hypothetical protein